MNLTSRLQGYTNHQIAYPNPIPHLPQPKTLHDKKDTTLLEMAMKAFLKQRLYGRFHNFDILNKNNRNHLKHRNIVGDNYSRQEKSEMNINYQEYTRQLARNSKNNSAMQHTHPHSYQTSIPNKSSKVKSFIKESKKGLRQSSLASENQKQQLNITQQRRLSQISSSLDMKSKRFQQNNTQLTNHNVKENIQNSFHSKVFNIPSKTLNVRQSLDNMRYLNHQQGQYHGSSFISALDFSYENQHLESKGQNRYEEDIKLPLITDKKKLNKNIAIVNASNSPKPSKALFKKQNQPSATIADDFWTFISEPRRQRNRKQPNQSKINKNQTLSTETNNLISLSKPSTLKMPYEQIKNSSIVTKANEPQNLNKESFMSFIQNQKLCIPTFVSSILNFFELNLKIVDKCQKNDFENMFASVYNQHDRAWCIAIFRFLDQNLDGQVDSSDLFKLHNFLEQIKTKIQSVQHDYIEESIVGKSTRKKLSPKRSQRQKTQLSQNQEGKEKTRNITKILNSPKQKTNQSEKYSEQSLQTMSNLKKRNEQNVKSMLRQVHKLNLKILQKDKQLQKAQDQNNPQKSLQSKDQKLDSQILYLEEALLKNKQLKLSDLNLIIEQLSYQNTKTKKKVIDIDYKKLNIKLSSSYVQTFIATNHNQETRLNREYLEGLKDYIKQQSKQNDDNSDCLERKSLPSIKYSEFYEDRLFLPLKNIFFDMFQAQISLNN